MKLNEVFTQPRVRFRQLADSIGHRLFFVPLLFVMGALGLSRLTLWIDQTPLILDLPASLRTTVDSARSMLTTIAGGLISTVTLLLTLMLVAVQLASSNFSPRTLRDWVGDKTQQVAIGFVIGTIVYCLLILHRTRSTELDSGLAPHLSVLAALLLAIMSILAVVRAVDHLTNRLRIGSVGSKLAIDTVAIIENSDQLISVDNVGLTPIHEADFEHDSPSSPPSDSTPVISLRTGWVQQVDQDKIFDTLPDDATVHLATSVGSFVLPNSPLAYLSQCAANDQQCNEIATSIAIGDGRTMQQDIGYGILQMTDIALRALSPGINDPNTANDMLAHLSVVMLALWERPMAESVLGRDGKTLVRPIIKHADYLEAAFEPILHYGRSDPRVVETMRQVLEVLAREVKRRDLPGPLEPITSFLDHCKPTNDAEAE